MVICILCTAVDPSTRNDQGYHIGILPHMVLTMLVAMDVVVGGVTVVVVVVDSLFVKLLLLLELQTAAPEALD